MALQHLFSCPRYHVLPAYQVLHSQVLRPNFLHSQMLVHSLCGHAGYRAIEAAADGCGSDVAGLSFWWSNCLHLRWMLWAMSRGEGEGTLDEFDWVMQACGRRPLSRESSTSRALCDTYEM